MKATVFAAVALSWFAFATCSKSQAPPDKSNAVEADLVSLYTAERAFFAEHNRFTGDLGALGWTPSGPVNGYAFGFCRAHEADNEKARTYTVLTSTSMIVDPCEALSEASEHQ